MNESGNLDRRTFLSGLSGTMLLGLGAALPNSRAWAERGGGSMLNGVKRIVFLGDSITYSGEYIAYLELFLRTRLPGRTFDLVDLGLPSETTSGLTEPGHAGGAFPRPCVHERLTRVLAQTHPDLVVACYGMNDGIYYPFGEERFAKYREGIARLAEQVRASGARLLLLTPPTFDPLPIRGNTLPAGLAEYRSPFEGYDQVLARYSQWLLEQRKRGWHVADVHGPMARHLLEQRQTNPAYHLAGDGVHTGPYGHWLMAEPVLRAWEIPPVVDEAHLSFGPSARHSPSITAIKADAGSLRFTWLTHRPVPFDPQWDPAIVKAARIGELWNRHPLAITGGTAASYRLSEGDRPLGTVAREDLAHGIDLSAYPMLSCNAQNGELLGRIRERQRILTDSWLTTVGHTRPGMSPGLPLDQALRRAEELDAVIRPLAAPIALNLRFTPAG